jgi:hypothetical protein
MRKLWQTHKQEITAIAIVLLCLTAFKSALALFSPETAQYDLLSETETVVWTVCKAIIYLLSAWFLLYLAAPKLHESLVDLYHSFDDEITNSIHKQNLAMKALLTLFFSLIFLAAFSNPIGEHFLRQELSDTLHNQLDVRETSTNSGPMIDEYLASTGLEPGYAWCAAFTTWNLNLFDVPNPESAWSPNWSKKSDRIFDQDMRKKHTIKMSCQAGDCFTLYYRSLGRVGHVGFIVGTSGKYLVTIEGNSNDGGSREGIGVFKRKRDISKIYAITNYITPYCNEKANTTKSGTANLLSMQSKKVRYTGDNYQDRHYSNYSNHKGKGYSSSDSTGQLNDQYCHSKQTCSGGTTTGVVQLDGATIPIWEVKSKNQVCRWESESSGILRFCACPAHTKRFSYSYTEGDQGTQTEYRDNQGAIYTKICQVPGNRWGNYTANYHTPDNLEVCLQGNLINQKA